MLSIRGLISTYFDFMGFFNAWEKELSLPCKRFGDAKIPWSKQILRGKRSKGKKNLKWKRSVYVCVYLDNVFCCIFSSQLFFHDNSFHHVKVSDGYICEFWTDVLRCTSSNIYSTHSTHPNHHSLRKKVVVSYVWREKILLWYS